MGIIYINSVENVPRGCFELIEKETKRSILVQTDWDYPGIASTFGWNIRDVQPPENIISGKPCDHGGTDGTIRCEVCGIMPVTFIEQAYNFIKDHDAEEADDPGYFERRDQ